MKGGSMYSIFIAIFLLLSGSAFAQAPATNSTAFLGGLDFSGFVDGYYSWNFNQPPSQKNGLRNFDFNHNSFSLNLVELAIEHKPGPVGFRADFNFGDTAKAVHAAEPGGQNTYQFLQQAYLSYRGSSGAQLDFGKYTTQHGAEVIETKDNWNYSRSLLFAWAIPYYHFGVRATVPVGDKVTLGANVSNGWNNVVDTNADKTLGVMISVKPGHGFTFIQNYMAGNEQAGDAGHDARHLLDSTLILDANSNVSLMLNYDYGMDRVGSDRVKWQGIASYAKLSIGPWYKFSPRFEYFKDMHGFATGVTQNLYEVTLTHEFAPRPDFIVRAEYRKDWSNERVFEKRNEPLNSKYQNTFLLGVVYVMGQD